jgi:hypothetical protein
MSATGASTRPRFSCRVITLSYRELLRITTQFFLLLTIIKNKSATTRVKEPTRRLFPTTPPYASFAGPVDVTTFKLNPGPHRPEGQEKACGFIKLGTYIMPAANESDFVPPLKGVHPFHIFVIFPLLQQPWQSICAWMKNARGQGPFTARTWISASGPVIGTFNRDLLQDALDEDGDSPILVIIPDTWEFIQSSTGTSQGPDMTTSTISSAPSTPSKPSDPNRVHSRNPFLSPSKPRPSVSPTVKKQQNPPAATSDDVPTENEILAQPAALAIADRPEKDTADGARATQLSQASQHLYLLGQLTDLYLGDSDALSTIEAQDILVGTSRKRPIQDSSDNSSKTRAGNAAKRPRIS